MKYSAILSIFDENYEKQEFRCLAELPNMQKKYQTITTNDNGLETTQYHILTRHYCDDVEIEFLQEYPRKQNAIDIWRNIIFSHQFVLNNEPEHQFSYKKTIQIFYPYLNKEFTIFGAFIQKFSENFHQYYHLLNNDFLNPVSRKVLFEKKSFKTTHSLLVLNLSIDYFEEHLG